MQVVIWLLQCAASWLCDLVSGPDYTRLCKSAALKLLQCRSLATTTVLPPWDIHKAMALRPLCHLRSAFAMLIARKKRGREGLDWPGPGLLLPCASTRNPGAGQLVGRRWGKL